MPTQKEKHKYLDEEEIKDTHTQGGNVIYLHNGKINLPTERENKMYPHEVEIFSL